MKKRIWSFFLVLCLLISVPLPVYAEGDGIQTDIVVLTDENRYDPEYYRKPEVRYPHTKARSFSVTTDFEQYIVNALENYEEQIDISAYQIPRGEANPAFFQVLNSHPELFYVSNEIVCHSLNNISQSISVSYTGTAEEIAVQKQAFEIAADQAAAQVGQSMTDVEKALVIHDYLIQLCEYDKERLDNNTVPVISHSAYGALVEKIAVCDGYGKAYKYIMQNKLGINCELVTSDSMNHAWNMIQIGGKWYHVDITWDDPTWDCIGRVKHNYFLLSDQAIADTAHKHKGWVTELTADSTLYDDEYWTAVDSAICYYQGNWYYSKYQDYKVNLVKRGALLSGAEEVACKEDAWSAESNGIWPYSYMFLSKANDQLYFSTNTKIKRLSADGSAQDVFTPEAAEGKQIFGFTIRGKNLCYALQDSPNLSGRQNVLTHELPELELLPIEGVSAEDSSAVYDGTAKKITPLKGLLENDEVWFAGEDGKFSKEQPEMIDAGSYKVLFKVERPGYQVLYGTARMNIEKAEPSYKLPTGLQGYSGNPLVSLGLSGGFRWQDGNIKMYREGKQKFLADFTPEDSKNYNSVKGIEIEVTVKCPYANSGHKYVEEVTKQPTETEKGEKVKTCSVCGDVQTEEIPATNPNPDPNPDPEEPDNPTQPELSGITAADVSGVYNGRPYVIEVEGTQDGDIIEYAKADGEYQAAQPDMIDAGTYEVLYKVSRDGFKSFEGKASVTIEKADPIYELPENLHGYTGDALSTVELPDGFDWQADADRKLEGRGTQRYLVKYTPADSRNYKTASGIEVEVEVECPGHEYSSEITTPPTEDQDGVLTYTCKICGHTYTEVIDKNLPVLTGITAADVAETYDGKPHIITVSGLMEGDTIQFALQDGAYKEQQPELINAGSYEVRYKVVRDGYQPFIGSVKVDISRANPSYTVPEGLKGFSGAALGSVELPDGFLWQSDPETTFAKTGIQKFYVCYRPTDQLNYTIVTDIEVSVEVKCPGHQYECAVDKKATETQKGQRTYTCKLCGKIYTEEISMLAPTRPARVSKLKVSRRTTNSLTFSWKKTAGVNYRLMFYRGSKVVSTQYVTGNTCTFKKLKPATVYTLRVTPYRVVNRQKIFAKDTGAAKTATSPARAKLSAAKRKGGGKASLSWKKVAGAGGYEISMKTGNGKYKKIKTVGNGKTLSFTKTGLSKKKAYSFRVRAYITVDGQKIYGAYSNVKKVRK